MSSSKSTGMGPLVSYLLITRDRFADLEEALASIQEQSYPHIEVVVVDNDSNQDAYRAFARRHAHEGNLRIYRADRNLGVCGGRNYGLERVQGDIIITLDDDAVLTDSAVTERVLARFHKDRGVGVLAFRILRYADGTLEEGAFPCKDKKRPSDEEFETTWFIGAGHAIRREVYYEVGFYRDYSPYGHEELDLSIRIVDAGWRIIYFPAAEILHKKTPTSRVFSVSTSFHANQLSKRIMVAVRNLPWVFVLTTAVLRTGQVLLVRTRFNVVAVVKAYLELLRSFPLLLRERKVVSQEAVRKMRRLNGPVVY